MINLLSTAAEAEWSSGLITNEASISDLQRISWNTTPLRQELGFAGIRTQNTEDGRNNRVLHLHPRWDSQGVVRGVFPAFTLPAKALFKSRVGFLEGATGTNGVIFEIWESHWEIHDAGPSYYHNCLASYRKTYTRSLTPLEVDLSHLSGKEVQVEIRVFAAGNSGQDWAAILDPRVETEESLRVPAQVLNIRASQLKVVEANETRAIEGRGDEPYLGAIYVHSIGGIRGSTKVIVLDKLKTLGNNIRQGRTVSIGIDAELGVIDLVARRDQFGLMGLFFVAMEEDRRGKDTVRSVLRDTAKRIEECFRVHIEQRRDWFLRSAEIQRDLGDCVNDDSSGGDLFTGRFIRWLMRGDDEIGQARLLFLTAPDDTPSRFVPAGAFLIPSAPSEFILDFYARTGGDVTTFLPSDAPPETSRQDRDKSNFRGHYRVTVQVNALADGRLTPAHDRR